MHALVDMHVRLGAVLLQDRHIMGFFARVDDDHTALVEFEVALDQRQGTAAD